MNHEPQSDFAKVIEAGRIILRWIFNVCAVVFLGCGIVGIGFVLLMCFATPALIVNVMMTTAGASDFAALVVSVPIWAGVTFFAGRAMWRDYR